MIQLTVGQAAQELTYADVISKIGPVLALIGVIATIAVSLWNQQRSIKATADNQSAAEQRRYDSEAELREKEHNHEIRIARGVAFAQLCRVYRTIQGQYKYLSCSGIRFIWLPFYNSLLPTSENLHGIGKLTSEEVLDLTALFYSYQEQMGYIAGTAVGGGHAIKLDHEMIGVNVENEERELKWVVDALQAIESKCLRILQTVLDACRREYNSADPLLGRLELAQKRNCDLADEARSSFQDLQRRILPK